VSTIASDNVNLTGTGHPERLEFLVAHPNYFSMLGATPQIGRLFGPQDFALGFAPVAVISDGLWRRSYGADPNVIGRTVRLDNDPYTIVGVLPSGFRHPGPTVSGNVEVFQTAGFSADPAPPPARSTRIHVRHQGGLCQLTCSKNAGVRKYGGEGWIRTLGTGVTPYNGLAKHRASFFYGLCSIAWHALSVSQSCRMYFTITLTDTQCVTHLHAQGDNGDPSEYPYPGRLARKFLVGKPYLEITPACP
jgi:hypothetical protein